MTALVRLIPSAVHPFVCYIRVLYEHGCIKSPLADPRISGGGIALTLVIVEFQSEADVTLSNGMIAHSLNLEFGVL